MAILTYRDVAPLQGFYAWAQANGVPPAVPCPTGDLYKLISQRMTRGTYAEAGDSVRFSAFLASGDAVIDYGGQWATDEGVYKRYNHTLAISAAGSPVRAIQRASAGWYRDAAVSLQTVGITGQTLYVTQELGRSNGGNFAPFAMLAQGWLTSEAPVSNRTNHPVVTTGGTGTGACICPSTMDIINIDGIQAAQGWQVNRTPAAGTVERVVAIVAYGHMGGVAINKFLFCEIIYVGVGPVAWTETPHTLTAPNDYALLAYTDRGSGIDAGVDFYRELPPSLWLSEEYQLQIGIGNFQPTDEIQDGYAIIEVRQ